MKRFTKTGRVMRPHLPPPQNIKPEPRGVIDLKSYLAYRVKLVNGTMVLCRTHLEQVREEQEPNPVKLTGETFGAGLCDRCHPERA